MSVRSAVSPSPSGCNNDSRFCAVLAAGLNTGVHTPKRVRTEETAAVADASLYKWFGVEFVPYSPNQEIYDVYREEFRIPILSIPDYYVVAYASSSGIDFRSIFKFNREAVHIRNYSPTSPSYLSEVWSNAKPLAHSVNVKGDNNNVIVAHLYKAFMPMEKYRKLPDEIDFREDVRRQDGQGQKLYYAMQSFYTEYFVVPRKNEYFILIELYRNGIFVALGATKCRIPESEGSSFDTNVTTNPLEAAELLLQACPWI